MGEITQTDFGYTGQRALPARPAQFAAQQSLTYYRNNMERMRYDQFRAAGLLLGSGIIESGCKQIVTQRLKLPGAQWNLDGAILTAKARTAWMSGEWQKLVSARSLLPLAT